MTDDTAVVFSRLNRSSDPSLHGGRSKIERHGWKINGKPAEFCWLNKNDLRVDHSYQRGLHQHRIRVMAREWDWVACGAIIVALRADGEWFVVDGQHRVEAALRRTDITQLPCLIFEVDGVKEEASGFLAANIGRKPMSYVERFNAMLKAGDDTAIRVEGMIDGSGRKISAAASASTVSCLAAIMKCMTQNERATRLVWDIMIDVMRGETIDANSFMAVFWLESSLPEGVSLGDKNWSDRIRRIGAESIKRGIQNSIAYRGRGGPRSCGLGLLDAINKGLRNPLILRDDRSEA